ncbi:hypothetical protein Pelo_3166 [Pelomyxa schiedti]|nr:hypothetical protein Pelo_3166 [Pelomyxa schiedti]
MAARFRYPLQCLAAECLKSLLNSHCIGPMELPLSYKVPSQTDPWLIERLHILKGRTLKSTNVVTDENATGVNRAAFPLKRLNTELVLLVDRSGSMAGHQIEQAVGNRINIVGFGSTFVKMSPTSVPYTQQQLEITWCSGEYFIFFALGIGDCSIELVTGLAERGNGFADFVLPDEQLEPSVMRLLSYALECKIEAVSVAWGYPTSVYYTSSLGTFNHSSKFVFTYSNGRSLSHKDGQIIVAGRGGVPTSQHVNTDLVNKLGDIHGTQNVVVVVTAGTHIGCDDCVELDYCICQKQN